MRYISTNGNSSPVSLEEALTQCVAADGGLFIPERMPRLPKALFNNIADMSLPEIAFVVASSFFGDDLPPEELKAIVDDSFSYEAPLVRLDGNNYVLELFHGPTLTFKDFGARFMARLLRSLDRNSGKVNRNVIVATTGSTGAAMASGLFNIDGVKVHVLYPKGKLSKTQTALLTSLGGNVHPIEVAGTVEDCKRMVYEAIADPTLKDFHLTGANSINIGRLIPQISFGMYAYGRLVAAGVPNPHEALLSVPCGNCSNLVAGVMGMKMGLPIAGIIAATNANNQVLPVFEDATAHVEVSPRTTTAPSIDMSYPSGWPRIEALYKGRRDAMKKDIIVAAPVSDDEIAETIRHLRSRYNYTLDPHGAVAYAAARANAGGRPTVIFATGHPARHLDEMTAITGGVIEIPEQLTLFMTLRRHSTIIPPTMPALRRYLSIVVKQ